MDLSIFNSCRAVVRDQLDISVRVSNTNRHSCNTIYSAAEIRLITLDSLKIGKKFFIFIGFYNLYNRNILLVVRGAGMIPHLCFQIYDLNFDRINVRLAMHKGIWNSA